MSVKVSKAYHQTIPQQLNELEVVTLSKKDPRHFEPLYRKYYEQIFRYINNRVSEESLAFDLTSQVFLKALKNISKYEYRGVPFSSWLYRIAKSEVYQSYRDDKSSRVINIETANIASLPLELDDYFEKENKIATIIEKLKELKPEELTLIELRYFENRSYKEIGEIMSLTENNAKVKSFRVIAKLKKMI